MPFKFTCTPTFIRFNKLRKYTRNQRLTNYCVGTGLIIKISFFAPFRIFSCKEITRCIGLQYPETATECTFDIRCWFPINSVIKVIYFQLIGFQHLSFAFPSLTQKVFLFLFSFFFFSERKIDPNNSWAGVQPRVRVQYFDPTDNLPKITIYTRHYFIKYFFQKVISLFHAPI